jgi:hypothetical protein
MHYRNLDAAIAVADPTLLENVDDAGCVLGCYRCLLSYYNQPDHELIDRTDPDALHVILRLARSTVRVRVAAASAVGNPWLEAAKRWGLPLPDSAPAAFGDSAPLSWSNFYVAAGPTAGLEALRPIADNLGFSLIGVDDPSAPNPPPALVAALADAS